MPQPSLRSPLALSQSAQEGDIVSRLRLQSSSEGVTVKASVVDYVLEVFHREPRRAIIVSLRRLRFPSHSVIQGVIGVVEIQLSIMKA